MKKNRRKKKNASEKTANPLPSQAAFPFQNLPGRRETGKLGGPFPLSYSITLPQISNENTALFLEEVKKHLMIFLQKEGEKKREEVWFAGLGFRLEQNRLILLFALCPFRERNFREVASITLSPEGEILKIGK